MGSEKNKGGFTLLEVIIVIIIVGVLASLALPRFFSTVEYSRATEAMQSLATVRQSVERCYLMRSNYTNCGTFGVLDVDDPGLSPGAHFTYAFSGMGADAYVITATRNTLDGGVATSTVALTYNGTTITRSGTGAFGAIQ